jgi:hypothetical protein
MGARRVVMSLAIAALAGCASAPKEAAAGAPKLATVKESFESFKDAISREDYDAAWETLSSDTRRRYPARLFWLAFNMTSTGQRYRQLIADSSLVTSIEKTDGKSAVALLRARAPEGWHDMRSFRMLKEDERWLVQFTLQEFFGIPEDSFFDFSKVASQRDFRHRR